MDASPASVSKRPGEPAARLQHAGQGETKNMYKSLPTFRPMDSRILPGFEGEGAAGGAGAVGLTEEQVTALIKKNVPDVNTIVNNAVANLKKTDLPKLLDDRINPINEKLTTFGTGLETLLAKAGAGA